MSNSASRPRALETMLLGGAVVAILDIANAMAFWALYRGTKPSAILHSIAAGLMGKDAFAGGVPVAFFGLALHGFIACCVAAGYYFACVFRPALVRRPFLAGPVYGALVYVVMNHVVVPLSLARPVPFNPAWFLDNLLGHMLLVGLPVALVARWSARRRR